ncbi:MAG: hypothetical protein WAL84_02300 [Candidatus Dormiibacterota bacterium]
MNDVRQRTYRPTWKSTWKSERGAPSARREPKHHVHVYERPVWLWAIAAAVWVILVWTVVAPIAGWVVSQWAGVL